MRPKSIRDLSYGTNLQVLSDMSLFYLDQAPALKKEKGDFAVVMAYVDNLKGNEKKIFIAALKQENYRLHKEYVAHEEKIKSNISSIKLQRQVKHQKYLKESEKKFSDSLTEEKVKKLISKINPNFCGVLFQNDRRLCKNIDFYEAIVTGFQCLSTGCSLLVEFPCYLDMLRNMRPRTNMCLKKEGYFSVDFVLCYSPESRKELLIRTKEKIQKESEQAIKENFIPLEVSI